MPDDEVERLILEWAIAKGGFFSYDELDSPETATLEETRRVVGLTTE